MTSNDDSPRIALSNSSPLPVSAEEDAAERLRHREWKLANREHIAAYNALVEREGVFCDGPQRF